jgi:hypothetical protein
MKISYMCTFKVYVQNVVKVWGEARCFKETYLDGPENCNLGGFKERY